METEKVLQQILGELKNLRQGQDELRLGQTAQGQQLKAHSVKLDRLDSDLRKLSMRVEHDIANKIDVLFDHREIVDEKLDRIEQKIDDQDDRLDRHWEEIMFLKAKVR